MPEDKLEIELDVNTKKAKDELDKLASRAAEIKVDIKVNKNSITRLENSLAKFKMIAGQDYVSSPIVKDGLSSLQNLISQNTRYQSILRNIRSEQNKILKFGAIDTSELQRSNSILQKFGGAIYKVGNLVSKFGTNMRIPLVASGFNWVSKSAGDVTSFGNAISNLGNKISNAKISMNMFNEASSRVSASSQKISRNIFSASNYVDHFSRRIYGLLRNAFIFNVIRRGFKGLSDTLFNLIRRDTQLARSLLIVKANLIRAFAPIWQVVLPWIRALGRALVWLSNRLISFINYLAGREIIKPVKEIGEAQKVVSNFMKIASPKKDMFDIKKPEKTKKRVKKIKDETKKAAKESNKLLASFDKLETLNFKKGGFAKDPFGLEELKKDKNGKDILDNGEANLEIKADTESVEQQIARAINQIEDQPLEFKVNDNIGEQITSEVNGLKLPTLDFKVATDNKKLDDLQLKLNLVKDAIIGIATAATVYRVVDILGKIITLGTTMIGPAGWLALAAGLGVGLALAFKDMNKYLKDADGNLTPFGKSIEKIKDKTQPLADELNKWPDLFKDIGDMTQRLVDGIIKFINDHPNFIENTSKAIAGIYEFLRKIIGLNWSILVGALEGIGNAFTKIYEFFTGDWSPETAKLRMPKGAPPFLKNIKIPGLAQGSVLNGGDPFLAYLNDQPRGQTNIEAPLSTMVSAFKQALSEGGYNSPATINLEASGDMSELIRMLNIKISQERIRVGNSFVEGY